MIKVNLLKNQSESAEGVTEFDIQDDLNASGVDSQKDTILKIVLMLLPVGFLMIWEHHNIDTLNDMYKQLNARNGKLAQQVAKNQKLGNEAKRMQEEVLGLEAKIQIMKELSKVRLRELKALDTLQNIIPESVWMNSLKYKEGGLTIEGSALSDESLNVFVESLEKRAYFDNVILLKAVEQKTKAGAIKAFTVNSSLSGAD